MTSHDVVAFIRRQYGMKKVGHTGTLDPQAAGVLPICLGQATRLADLLKDKDKVYFCRLTLGLSTNTQDSWGEVINRQEGFTVTREQVEAALAKFRGKIRQKVPEFSAVKVAGVPMYKRARKGEKIIPVFREIEIHQLEMVEFNGREIALYVHCSKGTYVRTLCHDIGEALGTGGHMSFLLRLKAGIFRLEESHTLEEIRNCKEKVVLPLAKCLEGLSTVVLADDLVRLIKHGRTIEVESVSDCDDKVGLLAQDGSLQALAVMIKKDGKYFLKPKIVFNLE